MELVVQKDATGCGFACIAMLSGLTYDEIKSIALENRFLLKPSSGLFYTSSKNLIDISLQIENVTAHSKRRTKFKSFELLNDYAILSISYPDSDNWHWVVFYRDETGLEYVFDPEYDGKIFSGESLRKLNVSHYLHFKVRI